ncbi:MAG: 2-hydroxyacyl-CoA dehydratase family protein [Dehalococcoidia bacterium]|nr:2-hydroxyacyl-CoA dehydratase family protein [Dehalococcoidia bacterium]
MVEALEAIRQVNASFPLTEPVKRWKANGGKVIGWSCIFVPEEIIMAGGMLPYRITGDSQELLLENANAYIYTNNCSFMRTCYELANTGELKFLDGFVPAFLCRGMRLLTEVWTHHIDIPVVYAVDVPRNWVDGGWISYFQEELEEFKRRLEALSGAPITPESLGAAIKECNRTRHLLRTLYELRKADNPPLGGADLLEVSNAAVRMPKSEFNDIAGKLLKEVQGRSIKSRARLMLCGSILNNPQFIRGIEGCGGLVVTDELCTASRYWEKDVDEVGEPMAALAERYMSLTPCACIEPPQLRVNKILEKIKEYRVDGVVIELVRNCFPVIQDEPILLDALKENGIPYVELDLEYGAGFTGQVKTRVEAFMEILES